MIFSIILSIQSFRAVIQRSFSLNSVIFSDCSFISFIISLKLRMFFLSSFWMFFWSCANCSFNSFNSFSSIQILCSLYADILLLFIYKMQSFLYRSYGSRMFLEVNVSSNRSRTSSRNAFSDNQTVVISCSAIIWFWNSVWIARCVVFLNSSRLIDSLLQCWLFGSMWCML